MKTIIEMAKEAGVAFDSEEYPDIWMTYMNVGRKEIEAFADLVRADEREENAKVCEKVAVDVFTQLGREHEPYMKATAEDCAMQIRERGQPKRKWVGLTDEEWLSLGCKSVEEVRIGLAIQAKLKEKNT